ncbi:MAG: hypothetical protein JWM10_5279 [Myxococcaceae bacterium]|nr:hypothetical protein [Myxococcaceae bacterium]
MAPSYLGFSNDAPAPAVSPRRERINASGEVIY